MVVFVAASYNNNPDAPHEPDGVCLVWNTKFKKENIITRQPCALVNC